MADRRGAEPVSDSGDRRREGEIDSVVKTAKRMSRRLVAVAAVCASVVGIGGFATYTGLDTLRPITKAEAARIDRNVNLLRRELREWRYSTIEQQLFSAEGQLSGYESRGEQAPGWLIAEKYSLQGQLGAMRGPLDQARAAAPDEESGLAGP